MLSVFCGVANDSPGGAASVQGALARYRHVPRGGWA